MPPNTHELITNANSHELFTKHNVPELEEQNNQVLKGKQKLVEDVPISTEGASTGEVFESRGKSADVRELDPKSRIISLDTGDNLFAPHELETSKMQAVPEPIPIAGPLQVPSLPDAATQDDGAAAPVNGDRERKVELLTNRMSKIREEKERLERIQELKDLEEQTKREILDAQRGQC